MSSTNDVNQAAAPPAPAVSAKTLKNRARREKRQLKRKAATMRGQSVAAQRPLNVGGDHVAESRKGKEKVPLVEKPASARAPPGDAVLARTVALEETPGATLAEALRQQRKVAQKLDNRAHTPGTDAPSAPAGKPKPTPKAKAKAAPLGRGPPATGGSAPARDEAPPSVPSAGTDPADNKDQQGSFKRNFLELKVPVAGPKAKLDAMIAAGFPFAEQVGGGENPHALSAAMRYAATGSALAWLYSHGHRKVLSVYGADRDVSIVRQLNSGLPKNKRMNVTLHRPLMVARDLAREPAEGKKVVRDLSGLGQYDSFLLNDVYLAGASELNPAFIATLLSASAGARAVWIGHRFFGAMGTIHGEGAWVRVPSKNGTSICSRPDEVSTEYGAHPALDWLTLAGSDAASGVAWSHLKTLGTDTHIYVFKLEQIPFSEQFVNAEPSFKVVDAVTVRYSWANWVKEKLRLFDGAPWMKDQKAVIDVKLLNMIKTHLQGKSRNGYQYKSVCQYVNQHTDLALVRKLYPAQTHAIVTATIMQAFYEDAPVLAWNAQTLRSMYGSTLKSYNADQLNLAEPEGLHPWVKWLLLGSASALAVLVLRHRRRLSSLIPLLVGTMPSSPRLERAPWWHYVLLAPLFEEAIKRIPYLGALFPWLEVLVKMCRGAILVHAAQKNLGSSEPWYVSAGTGAIGGLLCALPALLMHVYTQTLPYTKAVAVHGAFNALVVLLGLREGRLSPASISTKAAFNHWRELRGLPWGQRYVPEDVPKGQIRAEPREMAVLSEVENHFTPKPLDEEAEMVCTITPEVEGETAIRTFWYLPTNVPWTRPAATDANLLAVVHSRILVKPPMDPVLQAKHWMDVPNCVWEASPIVVTDELEQEWLTHFDDTRKRRRAQRALEHEHEYPLTHLDPDANNAEIMVKTDEVLFKMDDYQLQLKGRAIINVKPAIQAAVGPALLSVTRKLKAQWPWDLSRRRDMPRPHYLQLQIHLTYGADATDLKLTQWMHQASTLPPGQYAVLVSGDDSVCVGRNLDGSLFLGEGDASMYDQSQSLGPLHYGLDMYHLLGLSADKCKILSAMYAAEYRAYSKKGEGKRLKIAHRHRPMRATGGPDTSLGNTLIMGASWMFALHDPPRYKERFAYLGFDMKWANPADISELTFLKGMWYETVQPCAYGWVWGPLPSRFLKMGKSLTDPRTLYKTKDITLATESFASDLACSYAPFAAVPLVRDFVDRYRRGPTRRQLSLAETQRVSAEGVLSDIPLDPWRSLQDRYGICREEWEEMRGLIAESRVFTFLSHPGFMRLAMRDYA